MVRLGLVRLGEVCFGTAVTSDVTAQLNSRERGGVPDTKNPDLYFLRVGEYFYFQLNLLPHYSLCSQGIN